MLNIEESNMNPSDMLLTWLDGELAPEAEQDLFGHLQESAELRAELRDMLAISEPIRESRPVLSPEFKNEVMHNLGFSAAAATSFGLSDMLRGKSLLALVTVALVSSLTTGFILLGPLADSHDNGEILSDTHSARTASLERTTAPEQAMSGLRETGRLEDVHSISGLSAIDASDRGGTERQTDILPALQSPELASEKSTILAGPRYAAAHIVENAAFADVDLIGAAAMSERGTPIFAALPVTEETQDPESEPNFRLGLRGFTAYSMPDLDIPTPGSPVVRNVALSLGLNMGKNHVLGIEVGQEPFLQRFDLPDAEYKTYIEQNYFGLWLGAFYQYTFDDSFSLIGAQPYLRGFAGGTRFGPLLRFSSGLSWRILSSCNLYVGGEFSTLMYHNNQDWFSSEKLGVTLGIEVQF